MASPTVLIVVWPERRGEGHTRGAVRQAEEPVLPGRRPDCRRDRSGRSIRCADGGGTTVSAARRVHRRPHLIRGRVDARRTGAGAGRRPHERGGIRHAHRLRLPRLGGSVCAPRAGAHSKGRPCCAGRRHSSPATRGARRTSGRNTARSWIAGSCFAVPEPRCSGLPKARMTSRLYCTETATGNSSMTYPCRHEHPRCPFQRGPRGLRRD